jgi:hypothetical protein
MKKTRFTRRQMILGGATLAVVASAGALWITLRSHDTSEWIEAVVRRHLPNLRLDPASLTSFAKRLAQDVEFRSMKVALALDLDALAPAVVRIAPEANLKIERLERRVLSGYLLGSNFFRIADPRTETIFCNEPPTACGNPFARFRGE